MKLVATVLILLAACATDSEPLPPCALEREGCPLSAAWSDGKSDSRGVPAPIECTTVLFHPCPLEVYSHAARIDLHALTLTWSDASGSADLNGWEAQDHPPVVDSITVNDDGSILVVQEHGSGAGLRHDATLQAMGDGYEGDVSWSLFTVAGHTTFHVIIR